MLPRVEWQKKLLMKTAKSARLSVFARNNLFASEKGPNLLIAHSRGVCLVGRKRLALRCQQSQLARDHHNKRKRASCDTQSNPDEAFNTARLFGMNMHPRCYIDNLVISSTLTLPT
ncbi:hypothetical protein CEXT_742851 [Caerostris extrusa]|uniref:Uncharacterized protein n=1 Tax=Caerostris extrusa TaxID=172846 RepID=A0AAV4WAK7_CAEEX|nr:hypothetical protein CEXT_742851 [Caerostris extrusa]